MRVTRWRLLLAAAGSCALAGLTGWASPAAAQDTFQATPLSGSPGTSIAVSASSGCVLPSGVTGTPLAKMTLSRGSTVLVTGTFSASSSGAWSGTLVVPAGTTPGAATLGGACLASAQAEGALVAYSDMTFTVTAAPISGASTTPTGLPWAGSEPYVAAAAAAGLLLVGAGYRRRRGSRASPAVSRPGRSG
jgi:hypothetical protein